MKNNRFCILIKLEIKRALKAFPKFLLSAFIMLMVVVGLAMAAQKMLMTNEEDEKRETEKVDVGVVSYDDSKMMKLATSIVKSSETVTQNVNLVFMDEESAENKLAEKEVMAVIIVREDTMESILNGDNIPVEVKFQKNAGYEAAVFQVLANAAVHYLASAQAGVYSVYDFYYNHFMGLHIDDALDRINARNIQVVLSRNKFFEDTVVVATGDIDVMDSYIITGMVFFFFMFGINCITYIKPYAKETKIALVQNGVPMYKQFFAEFTGLYLIYVILAAVIMILTGCFDIMDKETILRMFVGLLIILVGITVIVLAVNLSIRNKTSAVVIMFLIGFIQAFLTGGLIPLSMLPDIVGDIGKLTPAYYMVELLKKIYLGVVL